MNVSKITIGRLFNLGSYEHVRYEITVEVREGESAHDAMLGVEKILKALSPECKACVVSRGDLLREKARIDSLRKDLAEHGPEEFSRRHGFFEGTPEEYIARCEDARTDNVAKRAAYEERAEQAREWLNQVGGAAQWKDAKLDWENDL